MRNLIEAFRVTNALRLFVIYMPDFFYLSQSQSVVTSDFTTGIL